MHIPDGYLSPQTYLPLWGVMGLYWAKASSVVRKTLSSDKLPLLAIGAAFSFVIMMFNVPIPGGTTGHAVGGALIAILLGPWAASIAISVALIVQALLFGDGGITAIAANCFTMAVVGPFVAWWVYRGVSGTSDVRSGRRVWGAGLAAWLGLNASALVASLLFGIQPMIAHTASGQPLYAPYPLWIAVPAMMAEHMLLFGIVEAAVTAAAVKWFQVSDPALLMTYEARGSAPAAIPATAEPASAGPSDAVGITPGAGALPTASVAPGPRYRKLWIAVAVLAILTPLGIWIPSALGGGSAWGEWSSEELQQILGFVPQGLARLGSLWSAALPDYSVPGLAGPVGETLGYVLSAVVGIALVAFVAWGLAKLLVPKGTVPPTGDTGAPSAT